MRKNIQKAKSRKKLWLDVLNWADEDKPLGYTYLYFEFKKVAMERSFFEWLTINEKLDKYEAALDIAEDFTNREQQFDAIAWLEKLKEQYKMKIENTVSTI